MDSKQISELRLFVYLVTIFVSIVISFTVIKVQVEINTSRIEKLEYSQAYMEEIQFNLKRLCEAQGISYINTKEK